MIFIGLFGLIAVIVIALNMYNTSNLEEIKEYLVSKNCQSIIYAKGSFKSLCEDKILEISNSFNVDVEKNSKSYKYDKIINIETKNFNLVLNNNDELKFSSKEELTNFKNELDKKLK